MKTQKCVISLVIILFFINCKNLRSSGDAVITDDISLVDNYDSIHINGDIKKAIDSFVNYVDCKTCIYEMYINKVYPDSLLLSLKAKGFPTENPHSALFRTAIDGRTFFVYSGLEDVFIGDYKFDSSKIDRGNTKYSMWTISIQKKGITIDTLGYYPFFPVSPPKYEITNK